MDNITAKESDKKEKGGKIIILIIEDDEVLLRALYILFHDQNYTIATATDGVTGVEMARRLSPDVVLLDLLLPKMNGFDVLSNLKSDPKLKIIPVIILSNLGDSSDIKRAKDIGADDYYIKSSTDLSKLAEKIKKIN